MRVAAGLRRCRRYAALAIDQGDEVVALPGDDQHRSVPRVARVYRGLGPRVDVGGAGLEWVATARAGHDGLGVA